MSGSRALKELSISGHWGSRSPWAGFPSAKLKNCINPVREPSGIQNRREDANENQF